MTSPWNLSDAGPSPFEPTTEHKGLLYHTAFPMPHTDEEPVTKLALPHPQSLPQRNPHLEPFSTADPASDLTEPHLPVCARHHWQSHPPEEPHQQLSPKAGACLEAAFTSKPCKWLPEPCAPLNVDVKPCSWPRPPRKPRGEPSLYRAS